MDPSRVLRRTHDLNRSKNKERATKKKRHNSKLYLAHRLEEDKFDQVGRGRREDAGVQKSLKTTHGRKTL